MEKTIVNIAPAAAETPRTKRVAAYGIQAPSTPHGTGTAMPNFKSENTAKHRLSKRKAWKRPSLRCLTG